MRENDEQYRLVSLKEVKDHGDSFVVTDNEGWSLSVENPKRLPIPKVGSTAKMYGEGLSIGEDEVLFNGLPLNQASQAEQLRVSLAIATAVQEGKEDRHLKVVRIMDGSLLDDNSMRLVEEFAEEHDFQVWIERIERDGAKIVIEDGRVSAREGDPTTDPDFEVKE